MDPVSLASKPSWSNSKAGNRRSLVYGFLHIHPLHADTGQVKEEHHKINMKRCRWSSVVLPFCETVWRLFQELCQVHMDSITPRDVRAAPGPSTGDNRRGTPCSPYWQRRKPIWWARLWSTPRILAKEADTDSNRACKEPSITCKCSTKLPEIACFHHLQKMARGCKGYNFSLTMSHQLWTNWVWQPTKDVLWSQDDRRSISACFAAVWCKGHRSWSYTCPPTSTCSP